MKKLLFLALICSALFSTNSYAQAGDPATMLDQMKEKIRPMMVEKTGLTAAQADRIIEINFEFRQAAGGLRELSEADRTQKIQELKASRDKKYTEIPLSTEQIASVKTFYEEMGKNRQVKPAQ